MNIAYFSNQFAAATGHGITRYSRELFNAIRTTSQSHELLPVAAWSNLPENRLEDLKVQTGFELLPWGRRWTPLAWTFAGRPKIESWLPAPVDVVHALSLGYPVATGKPYVVSIHDLGPLTHPEYFTRKGTWIMRRSLKQAVRKAKAFICVSQSTADELESFAGPGVADRISVVPEGVSPVFLERHTDINIPEVRALLDSETPFILCTGQISPRKNSARVIRALAAIADRIPHHLVMVGGAGWSSADVFEEASVSGISSRLHFAGYVTDEQLAALYRSASAFVHASLYEGFGLPVLEAMACRCPVITSNISSLPEIAGDAAVKIDPFSEDEISEAILAVCTDAETSRRLIDAGKSRLELFSWEKCAQGVIEVYDRVA